MNTDPSQIQLSLGQQAYIARQADRAGLSWTQLLDQFIPAIPDKTDQGESAFDAAQRLGLVGSVRGEPSDLASNPKHLEGFGE